MSKSTAVETTGTAMARVPWLDCPKPIPAYLTELPWATSDDDVVDAIAARILTAETADDVLTLSEPTKFADLIGHRIEVVSFVMRSSDIEDGIGAYAMIGYDDVDTGETGFTSCGASGVLAQLARMFQLGRLPFRCTVTEVVTGKAGRNNPLYLTKMEESF
jgi:hypothetical protein